MRIYVVSIETDTVAYGQIEIYEGLFDKVEDVVQYAEIHDNDNDILVRVYNIENGKMTYEGEAYFGRHLVLGNEVIK